MVSGCLERVVFSIQALKRELEKSLKKGGPIFLGLFNVKGGCFFYAEGPKELYLLGCFINHVNFNFWNKE